MQIRIFRYRKINKNQKKHINQGYKAISMNEEINQLEQYLLAKDRKAFVDALIKDTDSHYFFSLLEAIDSSSGKLTPE